MGSRDTMCKCKTKPRGSKAGNKHWLMSLLLIVQVRVLPLSRILTTLSSAPQAWISTRDIPLTGKE